MFHPPELLQRFRADDTLRQYAIERAAPWRALSPEELWDLVFGHTLPRSWMVWSDGFCPSCGGLVNMYDWRISVWEQTWKLTCPRCSDVFPKNDFHAFYRSGLDGTGVFDPKHADRDLLFNVEHPDPADPLLCPHRPSLVSPAGPSAGLHQRPVRLCDLCPALRQRAESQSAFPTC